MPQIQYPGYTSPPAFTKPTPATGQMDWFHQRPELPGQYASRGRTPPGRIPTQLQTTGANVFAVEQWALPKPLLAAAYVPTTPQQFIPRTSVRARGGAYLNTPWHFWDPAPEPWPLPNFIAADAYVPDTTRRLSLHPSKIQSDFDGQWQFVASTVSTDWLNNGRDGNPTRVRRPTFDTSVKALAPELFAPGGFDWFELRPDTTSRAALKTAQIPSYFKDPAVEYFPPTLQWNAVYPPTTRRAALNTTELPSVFRPELIEQAQATLGWSFIGPSTTSRAALKTAELPAFFTDPTTPAAAAPTMGYVILPDWPVRVRPRQSAHTVVFAVEQWPLPKPYVATAFYPDRTSRRALATAELPSTFTGQTLDSILREILVAYPDTTRRLSLGVQNQPTGATIQPLFATKLQILSFYPNTTSRRSLTTAEIPAWISDTKTPPPAIIKMDWVGSIPAMPPKFQILSRFATQTWFIAPWEPHNWVKVIDRRYDDAGDDRVGARNRTPRMMGF